MSAIKRVTGVRPAYDCIRDNAGKYPNTDVAARRRDNHGIHCEEWSFAVHTDEGAVELMVWTPFFHKTVDTRTLPSTMTCFSGVFTYYHSAWPLGREGAKEKGHECGYLGTCYSNRECGGMDFSQKFIDKDFEPDKGIDGQPESFWQRLEAVLDTQLSEAHAERTSDRWEACGHCDGDGIRSTR